MYESPINVYIEQAVKKIEEQRDNEICHYITEKFNVDVSREELIKALNYDRNQYDKGYMDGMKDATELLDFIYCNQLDMIEQCFDLKNEVWTIRDLIEKYGIIGCIDRMKAYKLRSKEE